MLFSLISSIFKKTIGSQINFNYYNVDIHGSTESNTYKGMYTYNKALLTEIEKSYRNLHNYTSYCHDYSRKDLHKNWYYCKHDMTTLYLVNLFKITNT